MARLSVTPVSLRVNEAGEDGGDGDAEWSILFQAGNVFGAQDDLLFSAEVVEDGSFFNASFPFGRSISVETGPQNILFLGTSGFELDDNPDDILPSTGVFIPLVGGVPPRFNITTSATGGGEGSPDFSYDVVWRVEPFPTRAPNPAVVQALTLAQDALALVQNLLLAEDDSTVSATELSPDQLAGADLLLGLGLASGGNVDHTLIA